MKLFFTGLIILSVAFFASLAIGSVNIPIDELFSPAYREIILEFRLPKAITALLAGIALSVSGLLMQALFHNPLADPFVLGINSGGSLGAAIAVAGFLNIFPRQVSMIGGAWLGSAVSMLVILAATKRVRDSGSLLIVGVMLGYIASSLVSILMHFSRAEHVQGYVSWGFGTFSGVGWDRIALFSIPIIIIAAACFFITKPLNSLLLGENSARLLGVNVTSLRLQVIVFTAALSGSVTAFCGPIAFIGLAVPHICRSVSRSGDHAKLLPLCIVTGGALALIADLLTHAGGGGAVLPLNAVTSLVGAPFVIHALVYFRKRG
ncbi:MAG: iron ABC transporter permease [Synergistaceae bacterium]|nr:iron ABC transporter permease [Synergistaceae bacterium]